jgi:uncharacterized protein (DUF488 family)
VQALFTIGFTRKSLKQFIRLLQNAGVDAVIDVRRNNTSQLAGFAKHADLEFLLQEGFRIQYRWLPELAPSAELLARYRQDRDWERYAADFRQLIESEGMLSLAAPVLAAYRHPCLLCAEDDPGECHRSLLADALKLARPELPVKHLRWENCRE